MLSKAFRASIPGLREDQLHNLQRWAHGHCSLSAFFRDELGATIFLALKDQPRSSASFARSVRSVLRRLAIDVPLRGQWVRFISAREVLVAAQQPAPLSCGQQDHQASLQNAEEDGDKVIHLR